MLFLPDGEGAAGHYQEIRQRSGKLACGRQAVRPYAAIAPQACSVRNLRSLLRSRRILLLSMSKTRRVSGRTTFLRTKR